MLIVTTPDGHVIDEVRLVDGFLAYRTGRARDIVEGKRSPLRPLTDERLYELAAGWSNGYVSISAEQGGPASGG
jgi:hypothetical protein